MYGRRFLLGGAEGVHGASVALEMAGPELPTCRYQYGNEANPRAHSRDGAGDPEELDEVGAFSAVPPGRL